LPEEKAPEKRIVGDGADPAQCHDHISFVMLIATLITTIGLAISYGTNNEVTLPNGNSLTEETHLGLTAAGLSFSGVLGLVAVWLVLLFISAWVLIILGQLVMIGSLIGLGFWSMYQAQNPTCLVSGVPGVAPECTSDYTGWLWFAAIVCWALAALMVLWLICIRERIAFTAMILTSVAQVLMELPELILIQFVASFLVLGYALLWALAYFELIALTAGAEWWVLAIVNILAIFNFFWVQLVLVNISLVTTAGAVGSWYYSPASVDRGCFLCRPAVCTPLIRACTLQLGSIALGSILVAVLKTIIVVVKYIAEQTSKGHPVLKIAFCCCICCLSCVERCIKWLSDYAFVYVAVYGHPFITSGMKVMELLGSSGIGAIAQQTLVSPVLNLAALLGGGLGGLLGYQAIGVTNIANFDYMAVLIGIAVGYVLTSIGLAPVDGGSKTLFVCYAESPAELAGKSPALSAKLGESSSLKPKGDGMVQP